jgi:outer membrane receptor protein involved in Fe transport
MNTRRPISATLAGSGRVVIAITMTAVGAPVTAEQSTGGAELQDPGALQEIVITAEKRTSTVQDTPLSISAYSGEQLERAGTSSIEEVAAQTPGVSFESTGPSKTQFAIRGMSSNGGAAPTVGFYLDDTPITPPIDSTQGKNFIDPNLYDLARVEILRGPQGTLYGSSSMGGTIRLITNQPNLDKVDASAKAVLSSTDNGGLNWSTSGMLNLPIVDGEAGLRLIATTQHDDGFIDRLVENNFPLPNADGSRGDVAGTPVSVRHKDVNNDETDDVRLLLTVVPLEGLTITPSVFYQNVYQGGENTIDVPPGRLAHYQPFDIAEPFHDRFILSNLSVKYQFDGAELTSTSAYLQRHTLQYEDTSETYDVVFDAPTPYYVPATAHEEQQSKQFTQETRISSTSDGKLQWLAGIFYSNFRDTYVSGNALIPQYEPIFGDSLVINYSEPDKLSQIAFFTEESYKITSALKATAGLRWIHYTDSFTLAQQGILVPPGLGTASGSATASKVTPKLGLDYTLSDNWLLYASAAAGTRPGAANLPVPTTGPDACDRQSPLNYKSDSIWSYEIGEKGRLFGGRVTLDGALFYINWSDVQQQVYLACGYNYTDNLGQAVSKGGELELQAQLTPSLLFDQNVGYTRATLTSTAAGTNAIVGQQLQDIPKYTASSAFEYVQRLSGDLSLTARVSNSYVSESFDRAAKPAYDLMDLRFGLRSGHFETYAFANNLLNRQVVEANATSLTVTIPTVDRVAINRPRTIGVELNWHL